MYVEKQDKEPNVIKLRRRIKETIYLPLTIQFKAEIMIHKVFRNKCNSHCD